MLRTNGGKNASVSQSFSMDFSKRILKHEVTYHNILTHEYRRMVYDTFEEACKAFEEYSIIVDVANSH